MQFQGIVNVVLSLVFQDLYSAVETQERLSQNEERVSKIISFLCF